MEFYRRALLASDSTSESNANAPTSTDLSADSSVRTSDDVTIVSLAVRSGTRIASAAILASSSLTVSAEPAAVVFDSAISPLINELLNDDLSSDDIDESGTTVLSHGLQSETSIDELTDVLPATTRQGTTELIDQSQYNSLPPAVQVLVNDILQLLPEDGRSSEQVFAVRNSSSNDVLVQVVIFVPRYWTDVIKILDCRLAINYSRRVARSSVAAMTREEITATDGDDPEGNIEDIRCPIFLEEWKAGDDVRKTACEHKYHASCILQWLIQDLRGSCPICRTKVTRREM